MEKLHPRARWIFRFQGYAIPLFIFIILVYFVSTIAKLGLLKINPVFYIILILLFIFSVEIYARLAYNNWKYEFTPTELKTEKGIIIKIYKSIPYQRIQNVEIHRGILARVFSFSSLNIHTAGYSSGQTRYGGPLAEGYIPAVSIEAAEKIREFLIKKIEKRSGL